MRSWGSGKVRWVVFQSLSHVWLLQHSRLPCPSLSPRVYSSSCPLSRWCHPTISSSAALFSSCPQSFPAPGSFPKNQLFTSGGQSIGASAWASVLPMIIQGWFPLGLIGLISCSPRDSWEFLQHHNSKASILSYSAFFMVQLSHLYMTTGKTIALSIQKSVSKVMSLLCNMLSRFVIAILSRSKCLLISWLQSLSTVLLESKKIKSANVSNFFPSICWSNGTGCHDLSFLKVEF